jgi:hypothetical protein
MFKAGSKATKSKLHEKIYVEREREREQTMVIVMYKILFAIWQAKRYQPTFTGTIKKTNKVELRIQ